MSYFLCGGARFLPFTVVDQQLRFGSHVFVFGWVHAVRLFAFCTSSNPSHFLGVIEKLWKFTTKIAADDVSRGGRTESPVRNLPSVPSASCVKTWWFHRLYRCLLSYCSKTDERFFKMMEEILKRIYTTMKSLSMYVHIFYVSEWYIDMLTPPQNLPKQYFHWYLPIKRPCFQLSWGGEVTIYISRSCHSRVIRYVLVPPTLGCEPT